MATHDAHEGVVQPSLHCTNYMKYPMNSQLHDISQRKLRNYAEQLDQKSHDLFSDDPRFEFWDLNHGSNGFDPTVCRSLQDVQQLCPWDLSGHAYDTQKLPVCRFIFLYSENSRSPLHTTQAMLMLALSYHAVVPWFLDFLFMFGKQDIPRDFRFSALRHKLHDASKPLSSSSDLAVTGSRLDICYNLKWPEESATTRHRPWSMRQTVVYSMFNTKSDGVFFIVLKGNDSISKELKEETSRSNWHGSDPEKDRLCAFESYLRTHLFVCESSCETWRSYINYLENRLRELTNDTIIRRVRKKMQAETSQLNTGRKDLPERRQPWNPLSMYRKTGIGAELDPEDLGNTYQAKDACKTEATIPSRQPRPVEPTPEIEFSHLQEATFLDEKVNEALLAVESDIGIMKSFIERHNDVLISQTTFRAEVTNLTSQLKYMIQDLHMYHSSLENLSRVLAERRNLVAAVLQHRNVEASETFALDAQLASRRMETMTEEMRELALRTKRETLSMSVIAGVTMFFLPGTFVSTLMSTPIVTWNEQDDGTFQRHSEPGAWHLFLALTFPLTFLTFAVWIFITWRYNSRDSSRRVRVNQVDR